MTIRRNKRDTTEIHVAEVEAEAVETETPVADAGTWITIEGPGTGALVDILSRDHGVRFIELREVKPWTFRARVVNYEHEGFQLRGFSINDGTYVSEVEGEQVQVASPQEDADESESGETVDSV